MPAPLQAAQPLAGLYPGTAPLHVQSVPASHGHTLHVQQHGRLDGIPALVLHGGPGSGCAPLLARFFDAARYRVICPDQRGAGQSRPRGELGHNTTPDLLDDLRRLRALLGIERWLVVGGSWGAALALAYAAAEPHAVSALLLRGSFLARAEDVAWFFQGAASEQPAAWTELAALAPSRERHDLLAFYARGLIEGDAAQRRRLARAWWQWEQALGAPPPKSSAPTGPAPTPASPAAPTGAGLDALVDRYRVQAHYLLHDCWLAQPTLLQRCADVPHVPTLMLHGTADRICRPEGALALHRALPHGRLRWVDGAGHDPTHPAMASAMVRALDHYAAQRSFDAEQVVGARPRSTASVPRAGEQPASERPCDSC